jgi:adenosylcobinamide kinase/adenosylcobinamide-phosphate guanylyltransferase
MARPLVVILGGTRSGKSRFGRDRSAALGAEGPVAYIGTAVGGDPELDDRIAGHRRDRPTGWATLEPGPDVARAIRDQTPATTILLDGLTLWLSLIAGDHLGSLEPILDGAVADLREAIAGHDGPVIVVSDEIGLGLVPLEPVSRTFRDLLGIVHQQLVADSDEAWLVVAGRPLRLPEAIAR